MPKFRCPLCQSELSETHYHKVVGVEREREGLLKKLREQAAALKQQAGEQRAALVHERKTLHADFERKVRARIAKATDEAREDAAADQRRQLRKMSQTIREQGELIRKLQESSRPQERGLWTEEDLERELRRAFPEDLISRVGRGQRGADIIHQVRFGRQICGIIVYECKAVQGWQNGYVKQLRRAAEEHDARFAVLVTSAFPRNQGGFCTTSGCLAVNHSGALDLAGILRTAILDVEQQRLGADEREKAAAQLVGFIGGPEFAGYMRRIVEAASDLDGQLRKEKDAHERWWKDRAGASATIAAQAKAVTDKVRTTIERAKKMSVIDGGRAATASVA